MIINRNIVNSAALLISIATVNHAAATSKDFTQPDVADLDMADLLKVQVTSVSKKAQALSDAPAAAFVISNEDIKRSGVTSIPEALRMAPGIDVARINSNTWAVTARGFNGRFANKLLVLLDGRSVYSPAFSGVYWDAQDVMLEDVERIEVIRGPGATLWGANAVNGVINIITKKVEDTQGGLLAAGGGTLETSFGAARYGSKLADETYGRIYVKGFQRDEFQTVAGGGSGDDWHKEQGGFRVDSRLSDKDELTLQGDIYQTHENQGVSNPIYTEPYAQLVNGKPKMTGWNMTSRFKHTVSMTSEYSLQFYYDHYARSEDYEAESRDTLDIDFQHNFQLMDRHSIIWGLGYRYSGDTFTPKFILSMNPASRNTQLVSGFIQDEMMLVDDKLWLTLGSKFEHNDYTGFEGQPTVRLMWAPSPSQRVWSSISRAVRTPSRAESDVTLLEGVYPVTFLNSTLPLPITLNGNPNFKAEQLLAYEIGYRFTLANRVSLDFTAFYNDYSTLRTTTVGGVDTTGALQNFFANAGSANTEGFEASTVWQMNDWWRWDTNYSFLNTVFEKSSFDQTLTPVSPQHKVSLRAEISPSDTVNLDFWLRYVSNAKAINPKTLSRFSINGYVTLDTRLSWKCLSTLELSLIGQNLLDSRHLEYIDESFILPTEISRGVYGKMTLTF